MKGEKKREEERRREKKRAEERRREKKREEGRRREIPSAGSLKTAKGCRKIGSLTKAGSASLCNGDWATCCPSWLVPVCYTDEAGLGLVQQMETTAPALVVNNRWDVPGCQGVCRKPLKANCHSVNLFTKYDVGPECGSLKTAKGCKKMGSLTKSASCSLCNEFPSATCCPSWLVPVCYTQQDSNSRNELQRG